jgi:ubiquitin C-terminal hydrolase
MNSTLQCLSQTKGLTNYFLNDKNKNKIINNNISRNNKNDPQITPVYSVLIKKLWDKNNFSSKDYSPYKFMETIEKMNSLFKKGEAGDSKDFIIYILEQFHKELKKSVKPLIQNNNNSRKTDTSLNQYDKNNVFNHFFEQFQNECSIISDLFFGINEITNECLYCKMQYNSQGQNNPICYNYGIFNCLIFPLQEVNNMKNNSMQNNNFINMYQNNRVSIYECFYYNQKTELFTGANRNYCNHCNQLFDSNYTTRIFSSPNILVLILNRGKNNMYDIKIDFTEEIDIAQFVLARDKPEMIYNLYGVITHIGQSGPNAHFVASCKSPIDKKWYRYNDALVNPINNIQKDVIEFGTPYKLFYEKSEKLENN